jgi:fumarate hydratase class I
MPRRGCRKKEVAIKKIQFPITEKQIRQLKIGDLVSISGRIFLGRDQVHAFAAKNDLPKDLAGSAIYHCGPVAVNNLERITKNVKKDAKFDEWRFLAAGPTTSIREEPYEADFIAKTGVRAVIGKGGMGAKTLAALAKHGAVYCHAIGGAAAFYADTVKKVVDVSLLEEFGTPEALWEIEVEGFLAVVTMDSHGGTLH